MKPDFVEHPTLGVGRVVSRADGKVEVEFGNGRTSKFHETFPGLRPATGWTVSEWLERRPRSSLHEYPTDMDGDDLMSRGRRWGGCYERGKKR